MVISNSLAGKFDAEWEMFGACTKVGCGSILLKNSRIFGERELIHRGGIVGDMHLTRHADMTMIDAVKHIGVLIGTNQKRFDGHRLSADILICLDEAWCILGRAGETFAELRENSRSPQETLIHRDSARLQLANQSKELGQGRVKANDPEAQGAQRDVAESE